MVGPGTFSRRKCNCVKHGFSEGAQSAPAGRQPNSHGRRGKRPRGKWDERREEGRREWESRLCEGSQTDRHPVRQTDRRTSITGRVQSISCRHHVPETIHLNRSTIYPISSNENIKGDDPGRPLRAAGVYECSAPSGPWRLHPEQATGLKGGSDRGRGRANNDHNNRDNSYFYR